MATETDETSLVHDTNPTLKIPSTTNPVASPDALALNTWGFSKWADGQVVAPTTFSAIPKDSTPLTIRTTDTLGANSNTKLTFGARISNITAGDYENRLVFTATSNYVPEPSLVGITDMQDATRARCIATPAGTTVNLKDTRDNKVYRVRKMADGNCWMADNLAFQPGTTGSPTFTPAAVQVSGTQTSENAQAQYALNTGYNTAAGHTTYLYNWCAALGDTSVNCAASVAANTSQTVVAGVTTNGTDTSQPEVVGICPAPFRLPKGGPQATTAGSYANTANEFVRLDIGMGGTGQARNSANTYPNFMANNNADSTGKSWSGVLSGVFSSGFSYQGAYGYWWSSTAINSDSSYLLHLISLSLRVHPANFYSKADSYAVRCVL